MKVLLFLLHINGLQMNGLLGNYTNNYPYFFNITNCKDVQFT